LSPRAYTEFVDPDAIIASAAAHTPQTYPVTASPTHRRAGRV